MDADLLYPLWISRDRRYDGKVFAGVRTTGVYCRPICPARTALKKNMTFFASAAAAEAAGFRPCLRCRPETSPGTPAWVGTSVTVSRAVRLIASGWAGEHGLDALAERLGVGERQLRRLFEKHLGAPPVAILNTHQLDVARKLLDETGVPVAEVAFAAGFSSLRRFNDAFKSRFGAAPTQMRKKRASAPKGQLGLRLAYRPPLDWESLIEFLRGRAVPGVERCEDDAYSRTFSIDGAEGWLSVRPGRTPGALELRVSPVPASTLVKIVERMRAVLDLDADPRAIEVALARRPELKRVVERHPGLRVPGAWDGFEIGVRAILGQQVSVAAARTFAARVVDAFGARLRSPGPEGLTHLFPSPETIASAELERCGVVRARAKAIRDFAAAVRAGRIRFDLEPAAFREAMTAVPGIGPWTADYVAMRSLREPDILLTTDLVVRRELEGLGKSRDSRAGCAPWGSYATLYLWKKGSLR